MMRPATPSTTAPNSYSYDARGRLIGSRNTSNGIIGSYKVNALGQREYKKRGTVVTHFIYDEAGHMLGEYKGAGALSQDTSYLGDVPTNAARWNSAKADRGSS